MKSLTLALIISCFAMAAKAELTPLNPHSNLAPHFSTTLKEGQLTLGDTPPLVQAAFRQQCDWMHQTPDGQYISDDLHVKRVPFEQKNNEHNELIMLLCNMGAYNPSYIIWLVTRNGPDTVYSWKQLHAASFLGDHLISKSHFFYPDFDPDTKRLKVNAKGRGLGDCGSAAHYQLESTNLILMAAWDKNDCDTVPLLPVGADQPDDNYLIYEAPNFTKKN